MTILAVNDLADMDIGAIYEDLRIKAGRKGAVDYDSRFETLFRRLVEFPEIGSPRPLFGMGIRMCLINPYVVLYRFDNHLDEVEILRVLHGKRNITEGDLPSR